MFGLFKKKKATYEMKAVVDGAVVPMTEATDPVFSSCALGNGVVILYRPWYWCGSWRDNGHR